MSLKQPIDVVVFAPHPDDAEIGTGGFLAKMRSEGYRTAVVDLTRGELGTKGSSAIRADEAAAATIILKLHQRIGLDLGDGNLQDTPELRKEVISVIRSLKPRLILSTGDQDEHPDHRATFQLVRSSFFLARLSKYDTGQPFHATEQFWTYGIHSENPSSFVVDITQQFPTKRKAVEAYSSQFIQAELPEGYRYAGVSQYLDLIEWRARLWGQKIGVAYGEAFTAVTTLRIDRPFPA